MNVWPHLSSSPACLLNMTILPKQERDCNSQQTIRKQYSGYLFRKKYEKTVNDMNIHECSCPYCGEKSLIRYGTYSRRIYIPGQDEFFIHKIQRVMCKSCHHTQAIQPQNHLVRSPFSAEAVYDICTSGKIPYRQKVLNDPCISYERVRALMRRFKAWIASVCHDHHSLSFDEFIKYGALSVCQHKTDNIFYCNYT